jgi:hypothetical protein
MLLPLMADAVLNDLSSRQGVSGAVLRRVGQPTGAVEGGVAR